MNRPDMDMDAHWHRALNSSEFGAMTKNFQMWMYDAKHMADEVGRITVWFGYERTGKLPDIHRQCSHSPTEPILENHLSCCLGVKCRECPFLLALQKADVSPEQLDEMKAWTCASHILHEKATRMIDDTTGYIMHEGDKMYLMNLFQSLSGGFTDMPDSDE